ncbi:MAG: phenylacetate-CoA oxygenase subunit PaaC [Rhizobiales bacterium]|nr:phenylacetate-CoA oxygenase subunit PaaC [Hyphomicrobiales bacterium]
MTNENLYKYLIRMADNSLIFGHRISEWTGKCPTLEEDIALSNFALDFVGQSRSLYTYAAAIEGKGRDEDQLAYVKLLHDYKNILLLEQPNGDFGYTIMRAFIYSTFMHKFWLKMLNSKDETLAAIAAKSEKEAAYHVRHSAEWVIRLGDGTQESHNRMQTAADEIWRFTAEMFETDEIEMALIADGVAIDPKEIQDEWLSYIQEIFEMATLTLNQDVFMQTGGRSGQHSEYLGYILCELQWVQLTYPNSKW